MSIRLVLNRLEECQVSRATSGRFESGVTVCYFLVPDGESVHVLSLRSWIMRTRLKICCISSIGEAFLAIEHGADALGLVGKMPSGPGPIDDELIRTIAEKIPPGIASFLLTSEITAEEIIAHHTRTRTNTIQIVDYIPEAEYEKLRNALPAIRLVQVIHVEDENSISRASRVAPYVDGILLDSGKVNAETKILGGTGRAHNWAISREIVQKVGRPVFLAGGIRPENVREAIETVRPFGIDLCTGVRTYGKLDAEKVLQLTKEIARSDAGI